MKKACVVIVMLLSACMLDVRGTEPITGTVVDGSSGAPMADFFVIAKWRAVSTDGVGSRSYCDDLQITKTDTNGRFRLDGSRSPAERTVFAFSPGYISAPPRLNAPAPIEVKVWRFTGTTHERLLDYGRYDALLGCGGRASSVEKLRPLYRALDEDAATLKDASRREVWPNMFTRRLDQYEERLKQESK